MLSGVGGRLVAIGGLSPDVNDTALHRFVRSTAGRARPRVCYVPAASGDFDRYVELFYEQYPRSECEPTHLELLRGVPRAPAAVVAEQDVVYIGGGSTPILVAALRIHGLDAVLRELWEAGGVVCGDSAGAHVWFEGCITDSLGPDLQAFPDGLGFVAGSCVAHLDEGRTELAAAALLGGGLPGPIWGIPDGAALVFEGTNVAEAVTSREAGVVVQLERTNGTVSSRNIAARRLR